MLTLERTYWDRGFRRIAGVDEAGRGPLAGPVVAAAVVFDPHFARSEEHGLLDGLTDSKKLSAHRREAFFEILQNSPFVEIGLASANVDEIDKLNILRATHVTMARALAALPSLPEHALVDGLPVTGLPCASTPIVKGDGKSLSIAAASIVAKVARDAHMQALHGEYPQYGFARHKGYGTSAHLQAIFEHGPTPVHRMTFRPVREAAEIRRRRSLHP